MFTMCLRVCTYVRVCVAHFVFSENFCVCLFQVRGIPVDKWASCVHWDDKRTDFLVTWYFSKADYKMPLDPQVPVRAMVNGAGKVLLILRSRCDSRC